MTRPGSLDLRPTVSRCRSRVAYVVVVAADGSYIEGVFFDEVPHLAALTMVGTQLDAIHQGDGTTLLRCWTPEVVVRCYALGSPWRG